MKDSDTLSNSLSLVSGNLGCISGPDGQILPGTLQGIYFRDIRVISSLLLTLSTGTGQLLSSSPVDPQASVTARLVSMDEDGNATAVMWQRRRIGVDVREQLTFEVFTGAAETVELRVHVAADFAKTTDVKKGHGQHDSPSLIPGNSPASLRASSGGLSVTVELRASGARRDGNVLACDLHAVPGSAWTGELVITPAVEGTAERSLRTFAPRPSPLRITGGDPAWARTIESAAADLQALRVRDPLRDITFIGAGHPWYMALFGRDTLIAGWQSLPLGSQSALEVLDALSRFQGAHFDERTGEQPGRILHELRVGGAGVFGLEPGSPYYGAIDPSALFVMLLAETHLWGADDESVQRLLPAARGALRWCLEFGDLDGDGYLEYVEDTNGLKNQGWKDSSSAMVHADGTRAAPPIALAEAQGYLYGALKGMAQLERRLGESKDAVALDARADALQDAFLQDFVLPDGLIAMALDGDKRPLAVAATNGGHCLWTGLVAGEPAAAAAVRLASSDLLAPWGVRTLGSDEAAYNPLGYHLGSIWPHDSAIVSAGMARAGASGPARAVINSLLNAASNFGWRLPELYAGYGHTSSPIAYPVACSPQAWSAGAPLLLLRTLLGLYPDVPNGTILLDPLIDADTSITVRGMTVGTGTLSVSIEGDDVQVLEQPPNLIVKRAGRSLS